MLRTLLNRCGDDLTEYRVKGDIEAHIHKKITESIVLMVKMVLSVAETFVLAAEMAALVAVTVDSASKQIISDVPLSKWLFLPLRFFHPPQFLHGAVFSV